MFGQLNACQLIFYESVRSNNGDTVWDRNTGQLISHEGEKQFKRIEVFIQSMTPEERENPQIMNSSRKKRIAEGSGIALHDINIYIKQFEQMRSMMKGLSGITGGSGKGLGGKLGMLKAMNAMKNFR